MPPQGMGKATPSSTLRSSRRFFPLCLTGMSQVRPGLNIVKAFVLQCGYKGCRDGAGR